MNDHSGHIATFGTLALIETLECYTKDVIERSHDKNFREVVAMELKQLKTLTPSTLKHLLVLKEDESIGNDGECVGPLSP